MNLEELPSLILPVIEMIPKLIALIFFSFFFSLLYLFIPVVISVSLLFFLTYLWISLFLDFRKKIRKFKKNT